MPGPNVDLIAIDLDGTLLDPLGSVSTANREAIDRARNAGIRVTFCTGRGLLESRAALEAVAQADPVVVAGGAIVACPSTHRTLHRFPIEHARTARAASVLLEHGHAVLVLKDALEVGYDYLVIQGDQRHPIDPVTRWWFNEMGCRVRYAAHPHEDDHPEHTVRIGACSTESKLAALTSAVYATFGDEFIVHHFPAVVAPDHASNAGGVRLDIFEMFDRSATKWSALSYLARRWNIAPSRIAAIGDQINDIDMISSAGLGVAMGNAIPRVHAVADRVTRSNTQDGVAHAVDQILSGAW
ncbi:MAG: HAD hydrolase family protein [Phycisphaeraceae bacterium]|nr:HAD hydrolase family protein [Phycisphaeraceae bacterium]